MYDMPSLTDIGCSQFQGNLFVSIFKHQVGPNTYTNGGIVAILMWIYRLVTVLLCQNKLYTIHCHWERCRFGSPFIVGGGGGRGGRVNDSFSVHAPVELHDIVLLQFRRIHSQLSYNRNIM